MASSVERVEAALRAAGSDARVVDRGECRTAAEAAASCGCEIDQIVKSILLRGLESGRCRLFLTAGGQRVDPGQAAALAGEALGKADADLVRAATGFAIGGVSPLGHLTPVETWWDPRLSEFDVVWAAAGSPRAVFAIDPAELLRITGATVAAFTVPSGEA